MPISAWSPLPEPPPSSQNATGASSDNDNWELVNHTHLSQMRTMPTRGVRQTESEYTYG